jgi:hypothetical protein
LLPTGSDVGFTALMEAGIDLGYTALMEAAASGGQHRNRASRYCLPRYSYPPPLPPPYPPRNPIPHSTGRVLITHTQSFINPLDFG